MFLSLLPRYRILAVTLLLGVAMLPAAEPKRPLSPADFDAWRSIATPLVSRDGKWLAYSFMPLEGDGDVVVRSLATQQEQRVGVGALPPAPLTAAEENPERPAPRREVGITFTSDSAFVIATVFPGQTELREAKRAKKKAEDLPQEGLAVVNLATQEVTRIARVKNMQVPANGGSWLAYLRPESPRQAAASPSVTPVTSPSEKPASSATTETEPPKSATPAKKKDQKYGTDLVLRNLAVTGGDERVFPNVLEYWFARDGRTLVFAVSSRTEAENGIFAVTPGDPQPPIVLASGSGHYVKFVWDRTQTQGAFATDRDDAAAKAPKFALYCWKRGAAPAALRVKAGTPGLPDGHAVSGDTAAQFSYDGRKLFVPASPFPHARDPRLDTLLDEEKVTVDLWHWHDDYIPPLQKQRTDKDRKRSYLGRLDLDSGNYVQLADPSLQTITANDDGSVAFGQDDRAYRRRADYDGTYYDLYLVDAANGQKRRVVTELTEKSGVRWSTNNRWIAYFRAKQWYVLDARAGTTRCLTDQLPVAFYDELSDVPESLAPQPDAPSYGSSGWTRDGESLLVYDRYDLWQVFPDGRPARNLTVGFGRANKIQLRIQSIDASIPGEEKRGVPEDEPLYLRGESEATRGSGFFRTPFAAAKPPERLYWAEKNVRYAGRALAADVHLISQSRFDEYPDLQVTGANLSPLRKVTDGGAQMDPFLWGSTELLTYRNADGVTLPAALFKPANFDPTKKYPMIVYLYERLSQVVHTFTSPLPSAVLNPPYYASNGYLILMPDIVYTTGRPGQSALKCVLPAIDEIVRRGYVDEHAIGVQGHSWGGYQIAYMVTQTDRFRAAAAGAAVTNMTSAYGGIRWGSGRPRMFQYEKTQSRIGPSLQADPRLYIENSPVFYADRVHTPLLMLNNDQDDAVPWYQGIEFFLSLRRYDKEVYLFTYNNEFHGLRRRADQRDYSRRMSQFFDHFLKGAPAPDWMVNGIPYLDAEEEKLRFDGQPKG